MIYTNKIVFFFSKQQKHSTATFNKNIIYTRLLVRMKPLPGCLLTPYYHLSRKNTRKNSSFATEVNHLRFKPNIKVKDKWSVLNFIQTKAKHSNKLKTNPSQVCNSSYSLGSLRSLYRVCTLT